MQNGHGRESGGCVELGFSEGNFSAIIRGSRYLGGAIVLDSLKSAALRRLGRRRHFSSGDKYGGHIIRSAIVKPPAIRKLHSSII